MEQLQQTLVPVVNNWRAVLSEELACIEAGRSTPEQQKQYMSHRAFLDCMQAYMHSGSVRETKHIHAEGRAMTKTYVCKRCVLVFQCSNAASSCGRCGSTSIANALA